MPTLTISRNPEYGDTIVTNYRLIERRNLRNQLITFKASLWGQIAQTSWTILGLSKTEVENIITFLRTYAGQEITIKDYDSITWTGIVIENPQRQQHGQGCQYSITFGFEGSFTTPEVAHFED